MMLFVTCHAPCDVSCYVLCRPCHIIMISYIATYLVTCHVARDLCIGLGLSTKLELPQVLHGDDAASTSTSATKVKGKGEGKRKARARLWRETGESGRLHGKRIVVSRV